MQKHPRIARAVLAATMSGAAVLGTMAPVHASGPAGSANADEKRQCSSAGGMYYFDLRGPKGANRPDIGQLVVGTYTTASGDKRTCAFTDRGNRADDKATRTFIEVGSVPNGGGTQSLRFSDSGVYRYYTDGRAITPSDGRCSVVHAGVYWRGELYERWSSGAGCN